MARKGLTAIGPPSGEPLVAGCAYRGSNTRLHGGSTTVMLVGLPNTFTNIAMKLWAATIFPCSPRREERWACSIWRDLRSCAFRWSATSQFGLKQRTVCHSDEQTSPSDLITEEANRDSREARRGGNTYTRERVGEQHELPV